MAYMECLGRIYLDWGGLEVQCRPVGIQFQSSHMECRSIRECFSRSWSRSCLLSGSPFKVDSQKVARPPANSQKAF